MESFGLQRCVATPRVHLRHLSPQVGYSMRLRAKRFPGLHAAGLHATPRVHLRHLSPPVGYAASSQAFSGVACGGIACDS